MVQGDLGPVAIAAPALCAAASIGADQLCVLWSKTQHLQHLRIAAVLIEGVFHPEYGQREKWDQRPEQRRAHQWQHSFVQQRAEWWQQLRPVIFGHAIYEMATAPFIGLTAKTLFVEVPVGFSQWPLTAVYSFLDRKLQEQIANGAVLLDNQQLTPLPVLGVPGWHDDNNNPGFYDNTDYFRPQRQR